MLTELEALLGARGARKLMGAYGSRKIRVPSLARVKRAEMAVRIRAALDCRCGDPAHDSCRAIARRLGTSPTTVVRAGKRIIETPLTERRGTVTEYIQIED